MVRGTSRQFRSNKLKIHQSLMILGIDLFSISLKFVTQNLAQLIPKKKDFLKLNNN